MVRFRTIARSCNGLGAAEGAAGGGCWAGGSGAYANEIRNIYPCCAMSGSSSVSIPRTGWMVQEGQERGLVRFECAKWHAFSRGLTLKHDSCKKRDMQLRSCFFLCVYLSVCLAVGQAIVNTFSYALLVVEILVMILFISTIPEL